jgi:hypothetical protein
MADVLEMGRCFPSEVVANVRPWCESSDDTAEDGKWHGSSSRGYRQGWEAKGKAARESEK